MIRDRRSYVVRLIAAVALLALAALGPSARSARADPGSPPWLTTHTATAPPPGTEIATSAGVCPAAGALEGVDVSQYQGTIDWTRVASVGKAFGYARVGDGTQSDPTFQTNYAGMRGAGLKPGGYLFFEPAEDPTAQAVFFATALRQANFGPGDLIPAIDLEITGGQPDAAVLANLRTIADDLRAMLGVTPAIYTNPSFPVWSDTADGAAAFGADPLWIGNYGVSCPNLPPVWTTWATWQYTNAATVPGISGNVDLDRSNGPTLPIASPSPRTTVYLPFVPRP